MKKRSRRIISIVLVCIMMITLAACGGGSKEKKNDNKKTPESTAAMPEVTIKDGVARAKQVLVTDASFNGDGVQILAFEDGWFYGFYYDYEGTEESGYSLIRFKEDGGEVEKIVCKDLKSGADIVASSFRDGCFYLGLADYSGSSFDENAGEGTTGDTAAPAQEESVDFASTYQICCVTADGTMKWKTQVGDTSENEYYFINSVEALEDGVYVASADSVDRYNKEDGKFEENVCASKEEDLTGSLYILQDGTVVMADEFSSALKISAYDPAQKKFVLKSTFPSALQGATVFPGKTSDFYLASDNGIYAGNLGSDEVKLIINYVNSDLDAQGVVRLIETEDGKYAVQIYGSDTSLQIYLLEPVAPEDVQEKTELTLGGYYIDYGVRSEVIRFNKESEKYRISLVDYSQYDLDSDEYYQSTGSSKLNTDIASGSAPDILLLNEQIPVSSYISKGVFVDLTERYESDQEIDKSDFLKNVADAFLTDGRMYVAVPAFSISGVTGKAKYIGDGKDLTLSKIREIAASKGIKDEQIFGVTDRDTVFGSAIAFSGDQFIDRDAHTCDFNNDQFRELLEFVKQFPETITEDLYEDYFTQYLADRALLNIQYINTAYDYNYMTRDLFGDLDITVTGFPSAVNKGPAVSPALQLGINSSASDPDGCWSFVRRFFLPEFQMTIDGFLPISEKVIDAQGKELIDTLRQQQQEYAEMLREMNGGTEEKPGIEDAAENAGTGSTAAESPALDAVDAGTTGEQAAVVGGDIIESKDLSNTPVPEDKFDGTHEEYEEYLKKFEEELAEAGGTFTAEVLGDQPFEADGDESAYARASLPDFNENDLKKFKEMLGSLTYAANENSEVWAIISEEAEAYFADQKSAEEVSDIIQSRVQVYLKENE